MRGLCKVMAAALVVVGMAELVGCQYRSKDDAYYLVAPNLSLTYWKTVRDGFVAAGKEYKVSTYVTGPDTYDPKAEADAFSKVVARHPAGILVSVADAVALRDDIATAISAGVPVITVDSDAPNSARLYFIGTNNLEVGRLGGKRLVDQLHGKGNVVFWSIPGQPNLDERLKGYKDVLAGSPGIKVVDVVATGGDAGTAFDKAEQYMHATGANKIDAFVSLESSSGVALAEVVKRSGATDRLIIAMDANEDTLKLVADGSIDSTIAQKPFTMGYLGLKALDDAHHLPSHDLKSTYVTDQQAPFPAFVDTGSTLITKYNVSLLTNQPASGN